MSTAMTVGAESEIGKTDQELSVGDRDGLAGMDQSSDVDESLGVDSAAVFAAGQESCTEYWCEPCQACVANAFVCRTMVCPQL